MESKLDSPLGSYQEQVDIKVAMQTPILMMPGVDNIIFEIHADTNF